LIHLAALLLLLPGLAAASWPGLPTRDQNPLLQGYLIPAQPVMAATDGWSGGLSLFITNTYQQDDSGNQQLLIDAENRRLDLQLGLRRGTWRFGANLSLIDNRGGELDRLILDWHDFFGLPQGGRDAAPSNDLRMYWIDDGNVVFDIEEPAGGLGDLQLSAGYQAGDRHELWLTLDLPSGGDRLLSNDGIDLALWWRWRGNDERRLQRFASAGVSRIHDGGLLEGHLGSSLLFAQGGLRYRWSPSVEALFQADWHSAPVKGGSVDGLDASLQGQFGLRFPRLIEGYRLDLYFSEDIYPGHAPDISFSLSLSPL
jgi:hypothetical protein